MTDGSPIVIQPDYLFGCVLQLDWDHGKVIHLRRLLPHQTDNQAGRDFMVTKQDLYRSLGLLANVSLNRVKDQ